MFEKYKQKVIRFFRIEKIIMFLRGLILPGFDHVPLYDVIGFFFRGIVHGAITTRAASLSFSFFLAFFPSILFFFTLIPYIPVEGFQQILMDTIENLLPPNTFLEVQTIIEDIVIRKSGGWMSLSFIMALVFATNGSSAIIDVFNQTYHSIQTRSYLKQRVVAMFLVGIMSLLVITSVALISIGSNIFHFLFEHGYIKDQFTVYLMIFMKWIVSLLLVFFSFSFVYFLAPAKRRHFHFFSAGSTLATILFVLSTLGFNYYVSNFSQYNALYGSIGTLIVLLLWIYFNSIILLIGFELNASIYNAREAVKPPKIYQKSS
ncbi:MAG: YihY/virulence factor BrkB family protein [Bacteroidota bacterium]|nr:YihY/virulence factor BrkB family protein [Bacteroidota bacterium]